MRYVEAPEEWTGPASVFLAGGITGCDDWQQIAAEAIRRALDVHPGPWPEVVVMNPRQAAFDMNDPLGAEKQIEWEYRHLHRASIILFWFPASVSPQPIAQYELGRYASRGGQIAVGADPGYVRELDVRKQMALARPDIHVRHDLIEVVRDTLELIERHV